MAENEILETMRKLDADYPDADINIMHTRMKIDDDDDDLPPKRICAPTFHFGRDVEARHVWGMDCYSRKNVEFALTDSWPDMPKARRNYFVNHLLPMTLNTIDPKQAHDIRNALSSIHQNNPDMDMKRASQIVTDAVNKIELINFAVHPKGHGVVTKIRIPKGTVVGEYFGEVYPAWRWAEKQAEDEAKRAPGSLPDFWNIRLDRPREDRKGYDVLYVGVHSLVLITHLCAHSIHSMHTHTHTIDTLTQRREETGSHEYLTLVNQTAQQKLRLWVQQSVLMVNPEVDGTQFACVRNIFFLSLDVGV